MPGELERRGKSGPHAAGTDDADGEPRGAIFGVWLWDCTHSTAAFRSSPLGVPDDFSSC
jgi:hypothetical protein